ncbi:PREDICTED: sentrin-specific protease 1-like [Vollenhovia emeryi]|uniref:sentrin-specific protease 1-like n=1 Tax=Vollenhovia emeryi TaxID=411798 RepID=UPI0005F397D8|nr:PREDICTED: sentrin-specific protease 1-like [Vollenhovia emeryi]XP_011872768.1 PREDICTED: sentrin-specific protease 1-like [Vollenhovia emeryi]XP_011872769.1 PREDICTED: sentrin-specific protease 1-like [Vollenhovia emeryi]XP_011872770.1 PREDICTED: sentrin-specific protease 1-like [Vollenhovia emeryi]XP_011872771.1 PREDICTED: sentrin-specific protease 1-like [Vollenhovia emeryi]
MTMIFDFLKKIFGWLDEDSKKRRASEDCNFEEEYIAPKRFKPNCNVARTMDQYFTVDDSDDEDIVCLGEQKCSPIRPCTQLNGTHKKQPQSYKYYKVMSPSCQADSSWLHDKESFVHYKNSTPNTCHKSITLSKTNQLREKYQYEEMLQNLLPNRIQILMDKHTEHAPARKSVEVIDLEKSEVPMSNKFHSSNKTCRHSLPMTTSYCRESVSTCARIDKVPTSSYGEKDVPVYLQSKIITIDKPSTSGVAQQRAPTSKLALKVAATNSLRDELAAKAVMRQDFIPQVTKRYNERIEQRHREAEELKKMTCVLSKHNRYAREAALEEQLARSMKLYLAVLDDREEPEEPALPTLTDDMLREVRSAISPGMPSEVLAEGFGLRITRKDLYTLADLNWLNDEVINFYMNLLIARGTSSDKYPKVHAMNTFFYPKLLSGGHASLKRWTRKVDIFAQDLMVVPVHLDIHWCMSIVDFRDKSITYYDSMGSSNPKCLVALKQYLQDESLDKKKQSYDMRDWKLQSAKNIPQQMNGSDCGVFSCMFAEYACGNKKITFTQDDMPYFRNKMVYEILKGKLL